MRVRRCCKTSAETSSCGGVRETLSVEVLSEPTRFDCTTLLKGGGGGKWWESMSKWVGGWVDEPLKEARNV